MNALPLVLSRLPGGDALGSSPLPLVGLLAALALVPFAVVMLTSRSSPFDKLRGQLAGCDEYLTKPVDENHLLEVIAKFLPKGARA